MPAWAAAVDHHEAPDRVPDHQLAGLLDVHARFGGDHRGGGVVGHAVAEVAAVGDDRQGEIAVGDEADGFGAVHQHDRADAALAHEQGDLADGAFGERPTTDSRHDASRMSTRASSTRAVAHRTASQLAL